MKICVVGAGAIGGILAVKLAEQGHAVSVIARGGHLAAIREGGLKLVDHLRDRLVTSTTLFAHDDPAALARQQGAQDVVILGLKANALAGMLGRLEPLLGPKTVVVPAINGLPWWYFYRERGIHTGSIIEAVDPGGVLSQSLDGARVVGCVVHLAGEVRAPGEVHHTGGRRLILGEIDRSLAEPLTARVRELAQHLDAARFNVDVSSDIRVDVWAKLIGNLSFNPVAALTNALIDQICADPALLQIVRPLLEEGMAVAKQFGITIPMSADERIDLARQLGSSKISMHQDFEAGRTPEIAAIVGAVIELADRARVPIPTIRMIEALVSARARNLGLLGSS